MKGGIDAHRSWDQGRGKAAAGQQAESEKSKILYSPIIPFIQGCDARHAGPVIIQSERASECIVPAVSSRKGLDGYEWR